MKNLCTTALCAMMMFCGIAASAQTGHAPLNEPDLNRPKLFLNLPQSVPVKMSSITDLFTTQVGRDVAFSLSDAVPFNFQGVVVSNVTKYENTLQSVVIRSTNFPGARLAVSRITDEHGAISYTGRILSMQHGDLYELKQTNDQVFTLVKKQFYESLAE